MDGRAEITELMRPVNEYAVDRACHTVLAAKHILIDWDGCLSMGGCLLPGAGSFLAKFADRTAILSNNSALTSRQIARRLEAAGIRFPADRIQVAGEQALQYVDETYPGANILLLASRAMHRTAARMGMNVSTNKADVVLVMRDDRFDYRRLEIAANRIRDGAILVGANPDMFHPSEAGVVPETGALVAAILAASGTQRVTWLGKPAPLAFRAAMECIGAEAITTVMIGDNVETDGAGATRLGMEFVLTHPFGKVNLATMSNHIEHVSDKYCKGPARISFEQ